MKPTRRVFLAATAATPTLVSTIQAAARVTPEDDQTTLNIVMDLMIPEGDGMPSASQAGGLTYLTDLMAREKSVAEDIRKGLETVEAYSQRRFQKPFGQLTPEEKMMVLKQMEAQTGAVFDLLRAYVYESYYTQPAIWKRIGYELYPTDHMGPHLKPFDDACVANVRKMPKLYKDA
jgi:hypothetical protein